MTLERLRKFMAEAVASGAFGPVETTKFVDFRPATERDLDQYMSDIVFGDVVVSTPVRHGQKRKHVKGNNEDNQKHGEGRNHEERHGQGQRQGEEDRQRGEHRRGHGNRQREEHGNGKGHENGHEHGEENGSGHKQEHRHREEHRSGHKQEHRNREKHGSGQEQELRHREEHGTGHKQELMHTEEYGSGQDQEHKRREKHGSEQKQERRHRGELEHGEEHGSGHKQEHEDGHEQRTEAVVIKLHPQSDYASGFDIDAHFHNEALFYQEVIPFFAKYDTTGFLRSCVPEFVYARATNGRPENDVIVLRDLTRKGFRMTTDRLFLDTQHLKLALTRLAEFHALSFKSLHADPEGFRALVAKIQTRSIKPPTSGSQTDSTISFNQLKFRAVDALGSDPKYKDRLEDLRKHCEMAVQWMGSMKVHPGPLSVLTRGDCTRNNLMFKYDRGRPQEVVFLDWAIMRYSSLAIDLSVLLTLNTSPETKRAHWDDFLHEYHSALSGQTQGNPAISFEALEEEMRRKGVYGYHWSVFLLPAALEVDAKHRLEEVAMDPEAKLRYMMQFGGPKATEYLCDIVRFMLDRQYFFEH